MTALKNNVIYTIGHSTHGLEEFMAMLESFKIKTLVDIRQFPASRKFPHFNKESLQKSLQAAGVQYLHMITLGGRRKPHKDSKNTRWNHPSFRGYADYMETEQFKNAAEELEAIASNNITAYMCSEAVWWRCHRSMVSDYLKAKGWDVRHIMAREKSQAHKYTAPAEVHGNTVFYADKD